MGIGAQNHQFYPWWPKELFKESPAILGHGDDESIERNLTQLFQTNVSSFYTEHFPEELPRNLSPELLAFFVKRARFLAPALETSLTVSHTKSIKWFAVHDPSEMGEFLETNSVLRILARAGTITLISIDALASKRAIEIECSGLIAITKRPQSLAALAAWAQKAELPIYRTESLPASNSRWPALNVSKPEQIKLPSDKRKVRLKAVFSHLASSQHLYQKAGNEPSPSAESGKLSKCSPIPNQSTGAASTNTSGFDWWWTESSAIAHAPLSDNWSTSESDLHRILEARARGNLIAAHEERRRIRQAIKTLSELEETPQWYRSFANWSRNMSDWDALVAQTLLEGKLSPKKEKAFAHAAVNAWRDLYFQTSPGPPDFKDRERMTYALKLLSYLDEKEETENMKGQVLAILGRCNDLKSIRLDASSAAASTLLFLETRYAQLETSKTLNEEQQRDYSELGKWVRTLDAQAPSGPAAMALIVLGLAGVDGAYTHEEMKLLHSNKQPLALILWACIFAWLHRSEDLGKLLLEEIAESLPSAGVEYWLGSIAHALLGDRDLAKKQLQGPLDASIESKHFIHFYNALAWAAIGDAEHSSSHLAIAFRADRNAQERSFHFNRTTIPLSVIEKRLI